MKRYEGISLRDYNTFKIDASCKQLYRVESVADLQAYVAASQEPFFILGGGSNLLISKDQDITILKNEIKGISIQHQDDHEVILKVGGGENWHQLVLWALDKNFGGLENLSLIPGTVGASPIQNIGAYGVELEQVFHSLEAVELATGKLKTFDKEACEFGYRDSIFKAKLKNQYFITHVYFRLTKKNHNINISYAPLAAKFDDPPTIREVSDAVIEIRSSKLPDPEIIGNSGSFFKNPIIAKDQFDQLKNKYPEMPSYPVDNLTTKVPAGWLIEQAGWKGRRLGDAGSYEKQALVLVNHGSATGPEIWQFAQLIILDVKKKFGIELSPEVNII